MTSSLHKLPIQALKAPDPSNPYPSSKTHLPSLPIPLQHQHYSLLSLHPQKPIQRLQIQCLSSQRERPPSYTPPTTKEEAIHQARTCLSHSLQKPLNNPRLAGKLKKLIKQPRLRVEIPVVDDSPESLTQLGLQLFSDIPIQKRGMPVKILILWPNPTLSKSALAAFESATESAPDSVQNSDLSTAMTEGGDTGILRNADVAIFFAPEASQLEAMKMVCDGFYPKPVVVFNPKWGFEEESSFGELGGFVGSFQVVYAFMGLEVRGILSKRKGVVFRCVSGSSSSTGDEGWVILVEEEKGQLKVISKFKKRPSVVEVENVLYNVMAVNSPVTKSVKFIRDLVSNVSGKKGK